MPILPRLIELYESRGIEISTGLSPWQFDNFSLANFTWFMKDGRSLTNGLGIAMQEIYFLECLFARFRPKSLFAIGNSTGWSSVALALLNPEARVVAIDAGFDRNAIDGLLFTNRLAAEEKLDLRAVQAISPGDLAAVVRDHVPTPIDFAFIDGFHSNEQVVLDFAGLKPHAEAGCVYLFHDVQDLKLHAGIAQIERSSGLTAVVLRATPSGMAIVFDAARRPEILEVIAPFRGRPTAFALIEREALRRDHRRAYRLGRSLARRGRWLRRRYGPGAGV